MTAQRDLMRRAGEWFEALYGLSPSFSVAGRARGGRLRQSPFLGFSFALFHAIGSSASLAAIRDAYRPRR